MELYNLNFPFINNLRLRNKIIFGFTFPLLLISFVAIFVYSSITKQSKTDDWVEHTHHAISGGKEILALLVDMETGQRGFLITGNEIFLAPFYHAQEVWAETVTDLKKHVADNPRQIKRLDEIIYLKSEWLENAAYIEISARKNTVDKNNIKTVIDLVETSVGKNIFDKIRLIQHQFIIEEQTLLSKRELEAKKARKLTLNVIIFGMLFSIIVAGFLAYLLTSNIINNLKALIRGTERLSEGDLNTQIMVASKDEFSTLATSFNKGLWVVIKTT